MFMMSVSMPATIWPGLELRHLVALQAVAEAGTFGRAAAALGYTQSAMSQQIAALEALIGQRLIDRARGQPRVELTEAGRLLLAHANAVLARLEAAQADFAAFGEGALGVLRVGTYQSVSARILLWLSNLSLIRLSRTLLAFIRGVVSEYPALTRIDAHGFVNEFTPEQFSRLRETVDSALRALHDLPAEKRKRPGRNPFPKRSWRRSTLNTSRG